MKPLVSARFTGHKGPVYALVAGPRPGTFLSGSGDGHVVLWTVDRPDEGELLVNVGQPVFCMHLDATRNSLFIGTDSGSLHVIDLLERRETQVMQQRSKGIYAILPVPRERLLCAGGDGTLTVYHVDQALIHQRTIPLCDAKLRGFAIQASGALLAAACGDGTVRVLDTDHFNEHHTLHAHEGGALAVTFHPTKPALVSAGKDGHLRLWHVEESFRELLALPAHRSAIYQVAFNGAGTICATAGRDKSAKCWRADTFDPLARLERSSGGHSHSVNAVNWIGDHLITAGDDRTILAWDLRP